MLKPKDNALLSDLYGGAFPFHFSCLCLLSNIIALGLDDCEKTNYISFVCIHTVLTDLL